ncbi:MAG: molybdopterin-guanine dinucleotide biosynthesis protein B [Desulfomonilia bacterium]|nr:molybdopterin-guanine dinucleotide biosynthesis protein B [Desulfomonilia bacterium]
MGCSFLLTLCVTPLYTDSVEERVDGKIISFVARGTNSGKTYLLERIIEELGKRGRTVAALKHSVHLSSPDREGKDTYRFAQKGATRVILFSGHTLILYENTGPSPEYLISLASMGVDIVLVEGYKHGPFRKIEVFNHALYDSPLCLEESTSDYIALISNDRIEVEIPQFFFDDVAGICSFLEEQCMK